MFRCSMLASDRGRSLGDSKVLNSVRGCEMSLMVCDAFCDATFAFTELALGTHANNVRHSHKRK